MEEEIFYHKENAHFTFNGEDKCYRKPAITNVYRVYGQVIDEESRSFLRINYDFSTLKKAKEYFEHIKKSYPKVNLRMYKYSWQLFRSYA